MALEPRTVTLGEDENLELRDMSRRFWVSAILAAPIVFLAMAEMIPAGPAGHLLSARTVIWLELILATPVVLWGGWPFFERGWQSIVNRSPNMFTLIALGVGTAYVYSATATLLPGLFPDSFRGQAGEVPVYFEAAAIITVLVLLGMQFALILVISGVFLLTRWLAGLWATFALFLVLSAGAAGIYGVILEKCSAIAVAQREVLSEKLCR